MTPEKRITAALAKLTVAQRLVKEAAMEVRHAIDQQRWKARVKCAKPHEKVSA